MSGNGVFLLYDFFSDSRAIFCKYQSLSVDRGSSQPAVCKKAKCRTMELLMVTPGPGYPRPGPCVGYWQFSQLLPAPFPHTLPPSSTVSLETGHLTTNIEDFMLNMHQLCFECSIVFI